MLVGGGAGALVLAACGSTSKKRPKLVYYPDIEHPKCITEQTIETSSSPLICDVHCHTFNANDLPIDGFVRGLAHGIVQSQGLPGPAAQYTDYLIGPLARLVRAIAVTPTPSDACEIEKLRSALRGEKVSWNLRREETAQELLEGFLRIPKLGPLKSHREELKPYFETVAIMSGYRVEVAGMLAADYPQVQLFTPALVDYEYWTDCHRRFAVQERRTGLADSIILHSMISQLSMCGGIPHAPHARFHGFVPFNPLRQVYDQRDAYSPTAMDLVKKAIMELGYMGVKVYPASGFLPSGNARLQDVCGGDVGAELDEALEELYAWCVKEDVPIMTHTSDSNGFGKSYAWRGAPWGWEEVLERHNDLRLNLGHFGHMQGVAHDTALQCIAWSRNIVRLMGRFPNVYADISNSILNFDPEYRERFVPYLREVLYKEQGGVAKARVMYGSDWWMNAMAPHRRYFLPAFEEIYADFDDADLRLNFFSRNALRFLGLHDGANARRLRGYYDRMGAQHPAWLKNSFTQPGR